MRVTPFTRPGCRHDGPHLLLWNMLATDEADTPHWKLIETAVDCAHPEELADEIAVCRALLERARALPAGEPLAVDDAELAAVAAAVTDGCEYMAINNYGEYIPGEEEIYAPAREGVYAFESPEDVLAARTLGNGGFAAQCWADQPQMLRASREQKPRNINTIKEVR